MIQLDTITIMAIDDLINQFIVGIDALIGSYKRPNIPRSSKNSHNIHCVTKTVILATYGLVTLSRCLPHSTLSKALD